MQQAGAFIAPGRLAVNALVVESDTVVASLTVTEIWRLVDGRPWS